MIGIRSLKRYFKPVCLGFLITAMVVAFALVNNLWSARSAPTDAYVVLGGSIRREIYMAQVASTLSPAPPILISAGSKEPCIRLLFEQAGASLDRVWLENCAESTFGNFVYSVPLVERWRARHVVLVTSGSHSRRALTLARILFGAQGIWIEPLIVDETGVPGNRETGLKTTLDIGRSLLWAVVAQVHKPTCDRLVPLAEVDLAQWRRQGFKCEHQAGIEGS